MRSRAGTHVYVAVSETGHTKVGATSNLARRSGQLRYFRGRRYTVHRTWQHDDPFDLTEVEEVLLEGDGGMYRLRVGDVLTMRVHINT